MKTTDEIKNSITTAIKEAVATNDEGLLDAAVQDYRSLLVALASKGRYDAVGELVSAVKGVHAPTHLINLKGSISSAVLTKAIALSPLYIMGLPRKASATKYHHDRYSKQKDSAPNAEQSISIARSLILSRDDDLKEIAAGLRYFAQLGHQQAMAILIAHCLDTGLTAQDAACEVFGSLTHLVADGALHNTLLRVLKDRKDLVEAEFKRMAGRWSSLAKTQPFRQIFKLDMLEKMCRQGLAEQAQIFASAYDQIFLEGVEPEPCVILRLQKLGVESTMILGKSHQGKNGYKMQFSPVPWLEHLLTNGRIETSEIEDHLRGMEYCYERRDTPFKAIRQVLDYQAACPASVAVDRTSLIAKASEVIRVVIEARKIGSDISELSRIIDEFKLPNELTLKVKKLKGIVLERDLGM